MYDYADTPHVLGMVYLFLVAGALFGWVPSAIGDWWRGRRRRHRHNYERVGYGGGGWSLYRCACGAEEIDA